MDDNLTVSSGDMLGDFKFLVDLEQSQPKTTETVLVATNKRQQSEWEKMYPGIKVVLQADYTGYPLPTAATRFLGTQKLAQQSDERSKPSKTTRRMP